MTEGLEEQPTEFIGRDRELGAISARLAGGERLVTLLGPAGAGKTRLAKEFLRAHAKGYERRRFCDLSNATSGNDIVNEVAERLGIPLSERDSEKNIERMGRALAGQEALLVVLDNCEQITSETAPIVDRWLRAAPTARFLVTSREPLGLDFESVLEVESLDPNDAARLFESRAARVVDGFRLDARTAPRVEQIVRRLDGLPLAIELATARLDIFGLDDLLERLPNVDILKRSSPTGEKRHEALSTALDWSWQLLSSDERRALMQSTVFVGTFALAALEAVLELADVDVVQRLCAKSLLRRGLDEDGERRFSHYAMIREFAKKHADAELVRASQARHAEYYVRLAQKNTELMKREPNALVALSKELPNTLHAVRFLLDSGGSNRLAAEALLALRPHMTFLGPFPWCLELVSEVAAREPDDSPFRARLFALKGRLEGLIGDLDRARASLALAESALTTDDPEGRAEVEMGSGFVSWLRGDAASAEPRYRVAAESAERAGNRTMQAECIASHATLRAWMDRPELVLEDMHHALELAETGWEAKPGVLYMAGWLHAQLGHHAEATHYLERALIENQKIRRPRSIAACFDALGWLGLDQLDAAAAERYFGQGFAIARETGDRYNQAHALSGRACAHLLRGDITQAESELEAALSICETLQNGRSMAQILMYRAYAAARQSRYVDADRAIERARSLAASVGDTVPREVLAIDDAIRALRGESIAASDVERESSLRIRFALRLRNVARGESPELEAQNSEALAIAKSGAWFEWPGRERVSLERSAGLAALLSKLLSARSDSPENVLSIDDCFAALAPGDRASVESKTNRVYVAMARLRKLGLRDALTGNRRGYRLRPELSIRAV